ncbi:hypothetical protein RRG08_007816 [Elysia crispata]|uniref:Protein-lysine N-methyltransferase SMYD4 n=1 Tax=Elysia crispata TaxID=231223 RepID=A0AAE1ADF0_9GAST|nr:hypothetical protein RRG08_007816 [Elysia crispata]
MAASISFGNWQQALDEIIESWENRKSKLFNTFQNLQDNESRLKFIFKNNLIRNIDWLQNYFETCDSWHGKSKVEAAFWKTKGNKYFQQRKFALAVDAYSQSCINAPSAEGDDLSLSLGNRSAALFHLKHYESCVIDIDRAISLSFPACSRQKLLARKTLALIKLGQRDEASKNLQTLKDFVESSNFSLKDQKRDEFLKEMASMELSVQALLEEPRCKKSINDFNPKPPKVFHGANQVVPQASQCLSLSYSTKKGRHLSANKSIPRGSTLIVEKPFAAVLLPDHYETHCHHCFLPLPLTYLGCKRCTMVRFCNEVCRDSAWSGFHSTECRYLDLLHSVGIAHLSLRVVLSAGLPFLLDFLDNQSKYRLSQDPSYLGLNSRGQYDHEYLTVFDLMTHEDSTERSDMLQYSLTAGLLLLTLAHSGLFSMLDGASNTAGKSAFDISSMILGTKAAPKDGVNLPPYMVKIGGLLLRHILQLVCNAHAITSIQTEPTSETARDAAVETNVSSTEQTRVATAIYPTASLMNHACDPTIVSSFIDKTLVVRTLKDVAEGDEIYNCYGPHYCRMDKEERQAILQSQYRFSCDCLACRGGDLDQRRFGAYRCPRCAGVLYTETCLECGFTADRATITHLKARAVECKKLFDNALSLMNALQFEAALAAFEKCRDQRREFLYKDHRDLALVEDAIARCYASQGDFCSAADHLYASVEFARSLYGPLSQEYGHELQKLAEVLFNAGRLRECVDVCEGCLRVLRDLYHPEHQVLREVKELLAEAENALLPQMSAG